MRTLAIALACLLCLTALAACGGGGEDDFSDIRGSATARATPNGDETADDTATTEASPTDEAPNEAEYIADVMAGYDQLKVDLKQLSDDMFAAQEAQSDPNTPIILRADIQAVNDSVESLRGLEAPAELAAFVSELGAALDEIENGTGFLENAIETQDQTEGANAFAALIEGERLLDDAIETLPS